MTHDQYKLIADVARNPSPDNIRNLAAAYAESVFVIDYITCGDDLTLSDAQRQYADPTNTLSRAIHKETTTDLAKQLIRDLNTE